MVRAFDHIPGTKYPFDFDIGDTVWKRLAGTAQC